jgi:uncharacterized membrane protein
MNRRLDSVDALRGAVMIIMALDHVRDFIHRGAMLAQSPTDLATTTPILFLTRWITHVCAPVFMLAAGMGAYFYWRGTAPAVAPQRTKRDLSRFLIVRGLWLIVLELSIMQLAYNFDVSSRYPIFLLVLWALGACMIILAGLAWLPIRALAALSIATIVLHHLADPVRAEGFWILLHQLGVIQFAGLVIISPYPLVPWFAVMSLGFCLGPVFAWNADSRRRFFLRAGIAMTIAFLVLRVVNVYGDPSKWTWQPTAVDTVLSFLDASKRPPSLVFLLMTLGPALMFLSWIDDRRLSPSNPLIVFGRVPLFYFILHFVAAHAAIVLMSIAKYGTAAMGFMFQPVPSMGGPAKAFPTGFGYDLWVAYLVWIVIVAGLYPLCRWFAAVKQRNRSWWLSYL